MAPIRVGIGDCRVSADASDVLITHALGSCVAILAFDPVAQVAGLLHYMLPDSSIDVGKAARQPFLYADTGIPLLFQRAYALGAVKTRMVVMAAGGAQMFGFPEDFHIGERNCEAMRQIFRRAGVTVQKEEVGGRCCRTVSIAVETGQVQLRIPGAPEIEMAAPWWGRRVDDVLHHTNRG